jgi:hypothetical protein
MPRAKKAPSTTAASAVKAMLAAATPLPDVPKHVKLREGDMAFWEGIVRARNRDEWTAATLIVAAQLARCQADIEKESALLDAEGSVIENQKGTMVMNPRHSVLEQLSRRELALMRSLQITSAATDGRKADVDKARSIQAQAEKARESLLDEDLLAT